MFKLDDSATLLFSALSVLLPTITHLFQIHPKYGVFIFAVDFYLNYKTSEEIRSFWRMDNYKVLQKMTYRFGNAIPYLMLYNFIMTYTIYFIERGINDKFYNDNDKLIELNRQLAESNAKYEKAVTLLEIAKKDLAEYNTRLEKANKILEDASKSKDLLLASVSHEFRNPLNSLMGNLDLLYDEITDPKCKEMLEITKNCGEVLLNLINNVLDVAKIAAEKLALTVLPTNTYKFIEKVWRISAINIRQKCLKGQIYVSNDIPRTLMLDANRIVQILLNLIGNSTKFTEKGGINFYVSWSPKMTSELTEPHPYFSSLIKSRSQELSSCCFSSRAISRNDGSLAALGSVLGDPQCDETSLIDLSKKLQNDVETRRTFSSKFLKDIVCESNFTFDTNEYSISEKLEKNYMNKALRDANGGIGYLKLEIIDTGCGISSEAKAQLFQPFVQESTNTMKKFGGTGLGLYITKQIIGKMNGSITLHSTKYVGSDFIVIIPTEVVTEEMSPAMSGACVEKFKGHNALVVEDDPYNQFILKMYLDKIGIKHVIAKNGLEAVKIFEQAKEGYFSFVTMDIYMPHLDGLSTSRAIREIERKRKAQEIVPIIIISSNVTECDKFAATNPNGNIKAAEILMKPVSIKDFHGSVVQLMKKKMKMSQLHSLKNLSVLVVDDDPFNLKVAVSHLQKYGMSCDTAMNGLQALKMIMNGGLDKYAAIIMDSEMPIMDGITATIEVKKFCKNANKDIKIIGVSGREDEEFKLRWKASGLCAMYTKPANYKKIIEEIGGLSQLF
jgi:signal transduction histidine kinase/DNA-binding response OmpR family regulator